MFDVAYVRNPKDNSGQVDIGSLLETLLYYSSVHWIVDIETASSVVKKVGLVNFFKLLQLDHVNVIYSEQFISVMTNSDLGFQTHTPVIGQLFKHADGRKVKRLEQMKEGIVRASGSKLTPKQLKIFERNGRNQSISEIIGPRTDDATAIVELITNKSIFNMIVKEIQDKNNLESRPRLIEDFKYEVSLLGRQIVIGSDSLGNLLPTSLDNPLGWGNILARAHDYFIDCSIASGLSVDLVASDTTSSIAGLQINEALNRASASKENRQRFESMTFEKASAFAEAVNDGVIDFPRALDAIKKSRDMRDWFLNVPPSADLVQEYIYSVSKPIEGMGLAAKGIKVGLFVADAADTFGGGFLGAATGTLIDALTDKIFQKDWKPSIFVNRISRLIS